MLVARPSTMTRSSVPSTIANKAASAFELETRSKLYVQPHGADGDRPTLWIIAGAPMN